MRGIQREALPWIGAPFHWHRVRRSDRVLPTTEFDIMSGSRIDLMLLEGRSGADPLFLQVKQAGPSVYEAYTGPRRHDSHGARVTSAKRPETRARRLAAVIDAFAAGRRIDFMKPGATS